MNHDRTPAERACPENTRQSMTRLAVGLRRPSHKTAATRARAPVTGSRMRLETSVCRHHKRCLCVRGHRPAVEAVEMSMISLDTGCQMDYGSSNRAFQELSNAPRLIFSGAMRRALKESPCAGYNCSNPSGRPHLTRTSCPSSLTRYYPTKRTNVHAQLFRPIIL